MIKEISEGMGKYVPTYIPLDRGEELEDVLSNICRDLGRVSNLTEGKADVDFILGVVGSYMLSKYSNNLANDAKPPSYIFNNNLYPAIASMEDVIVEEIPEDE